MKKKPIYVEIPIQAKMDDLWEATQNPKLHEQWDLRFSSITYMPKEDDEPQKFTYETKIGFGLKIAGWGKSVGEHHAKDGSRTSSLHFGTDQKLSIIREGRGYWKYEPQENNIKFFTQYDYDVRWGVFGKLFDRFIFRPMIGWATALSFDVARRWLETGEPPRAQYIRFFSTWLITILFFFIWFYHGLVPKITNANPEEIAMLQNLFNIDLNIAKGLTAIIGIGEVLFGLILLFSRKKRVLFTLQMIAFPILGGSALLSNPSYWAHPFTPLTFNLALVVLSIVGFLLYKDIPTAKNCKRKRERHVNL